MDRVSESIAKNVRSGRYFEDAKAWYNSIIVNNIVQRSYLILIACVTLILTLTMALNIYSILPNTYQMQFIASIPDLSDFNTKIKKFDQPGNRSINELIYSYLLGFYVKSYESYDYNNLANQLKDINSKSSKQVYKQFYSNLSLDNPTSPILLLQQSGTRTIEIKSVAFEEEKDLAKINFLSDQRSGMARITYVSTDKYADNSKKSAIKLAEINFLYNDIHNIVFNKSSFKFLITDINIKFLEKND